MSIEVLSGGAQLAFQIVGNELKVNTEGAGAPGIVRLNVKAPNALDEVDTIVLTPWASQNIEGVQVDGSTDNEALKQSIVTQLDGTSLIAKLTNKSLVANKVFSVTFIDYYR